ncbi:ABC transporter ATP-binding protein [Enterococcus rivorum]|uniref:ABC transporter domain-containing protein n=1 Tax=Enterococcus rivorum TaxID=762845 RepID=A0A1E5KTZ9_9ENTE|nr:ABC transporter ATP-binding protein [Enterococcus rivorum]MBP2098425.1 ABC-2 type transport system ATP-binding protein [Enterococcus rivorum]OEH81365.1 hypothetical protein BCR26_16775 [Enterococcus rivorum]
MLEIRNLRKSFSSNEVLKEINITIKKGEIVGLLGKNGAGKTTLIKSIMQLLKYDGEIYVDNQILTCKNLYKHISFLLEPSFLEYFTAFDNLKFLYGLNNKHNSEHTIIDALEKVGLEDAKDKKIKKFSYGMKQRLGLAQSLMECFDFLILDEPTVGIDPVGMKILDSQLRFLANTQNVGILLSSHELDFIKNICDRVIILERGIIVENKKISEIMSSYCIFLKSDYTEILQKLQNTSLFTHKLVNKRTQVTIAESNLNKILNLLVNEQIEIEKIALVEELSNYF